MRIPLKNAVQSSATWLLRHPTVLVRMAKNASRFGLSVPVDALGWLVDNVVPTNKRPERLRLSARPPGLRVETVLDLMGTKLELEATVRIEEVRLSADEVRVSLRLSDVRADTPSQPNSNLGKLLKSGAIDLKKPANLLNFMGKKPAVIASAKDDLIVVDLMKAPKLAANPRFLKVVRTVSPVLGVREVATQGGNGDGLLVVKLEPKPLGVPEAIAAVRS